MTQRDRDRLVVLKKARTKLITQHQAAEELQVSDRHVRRLLVKLRQEGDQAVLLGALELSRNGAGENHLTQAALLNNLAEVERVQWKLNEAESHYREALGIVELHLGPQHPSVPTALLNLGVLALVRGNAAESIRYIRRALRRALAIHRQNQRENLLQHTVDWSTLVSKNR